MGLVGWGIILGNQGLWDFPEHGTFGAKTRTVPDKPDFILSIQVEEKASNGNLGTYGGGLAARDRAKAASQEPEHKVRARLEALMQCHGSNKRKLFTDTQWSTRWAPEQEAGWVCSWAQMATQGAWSNVGRSSPEAPPPRSDSLPLLLAWWSAVLLLSFKSGCTILYICG